MRRHRRCGHQAVHDDHRERISGIAQGSKHDKEGAGEIKQYQLTHEKKEAFEASWKINRPDICKGNQEKRAPTKASG